MTSVPFSIVCNMLGIDAKTLRQWLKQSQLTLQAHPTDARIKCLTTEQVQQLALLHHRSIREEATPLPQDLGSLVPTEEQQASQLPLTCLSDPDQVKLLLSLQAAVTSLQQQVAQLALELLQERTGRYAQRLCQMEALLLPDVGVSPAVQTPMAAPVADKAHPSPHEVSRSSLAGLARGNWGKLPLIAYTATGSYVVICPTNGELALLPDTAEWFEWLATLSSFRFLGQQGRLSASRSSGRPCWMAYRRIHKRCYTYGLGNTKRLTLAHLEQMAATLQSHVPSLS